MKLGETDYDQPGYRENAQYSDQELEDMENEKRDKDNLFAQMDQDMPYVNYEFALPEFLKVAGIDDLVKARDAIDKAIQAFFLKTFDNEEAIKRAREHTKRVMKRFGISNPKDGRGRYRRIKK